MHELRGVDGFIRERLIADATLMTLLGATATEKRVYARPAPQGIEPPYIIATFLSSVDRNALGPGTRLLTRPLYLIRAVTTDLNSDLGDQIADRIDNALVGQSGNVASQGIFIGIVVREEAIRYEETPTPAGVIYQHTGGRYRFFCERLGG